MSRRALLPPMLLAVALGALLALALFYVWRLEGRWFYVVIIGFSLISVSLVFIRCFEDFLVVVLLLCLPLGSFTKWFFIFSYTEKVSNAAPYSGAVGLGLMEFILAGLYTVWFSRTMLGRVPGTSHAAGWHAQDWLAVLLVVAYLASLPGAPEVALGLYATEYLAVHIALYFYLSRHLGLRHLRWLALALVVAVVMESSLGILQSRFGMFPGLALDKGAGSEVLEQQYEVPGIEDQTRATGTIYDSHAYGLLSVFLALHAFAFAYTPRLGALLRAVSLGCLGLAAAGVLVSYSRSSWLTAAITLSFAFVYMLAAWRQRSLIPSLFALVMLALPAVPWALDILYERFTSAPSKIMSVRFEQYQVAFDVWRAHPLFGFGVGNYMLALDRFNFDMTEELPVHNTVLWLAADTGLFGVVVFYALLILSLVRLGRHARRAPEPLNRFAFATMASLLAYLIDGMSNPLFRDPVIFKYFWLFVAISVAMPRLAAELARRGATLGWPFRERGPGAPLAPGRPLRRAAPGARMSRSPLGT